MVAGILRSRQFCSKEIYAFPVYNEISLDIFDDSSLGFGYRAPYLKEICEFVSSNPCWLNFFHGLNYDDAMKELMSRKGIGAKVANCICLFISNILVCYVRYRCQYAVFKVQSLDHTVQWA